MKRLLIIAIILALSKGFAQAQSVPQLINYQGKLTDGAGKPLPEPEYELKFSIYDAPTGGTLLWGPQTISDVPVVNGHFNVFLGPQDDSGDSLLEAFGTTSEVFLEITVGAGSSLAPRQQVLASPYAMVSGNGVPVGGIVPWLPTDDVVDLDDAQSKLPRGFRICLGPETDDPSTMFNEAHIPGLLDERYTKGWNPDDPGDSIGATGGSKEHDHLPTGRTKGGTNYYKSGHGSETVASRYHPHEINPTGKRTTSANHVPPHLPVLYVIRVN